MSIPREFFPVARIIGYEVDDPQVLAEYDAEWDRMELVTRRLGVEMGFWDMHLSTTEIESFGSVRWTTIKPMIYATMDGKHYCLDYVDGEVSRDPMNLWSTAHQRLEYLKLLKDETPSWKHLINLVAPEWFSVMIGNRYVQQLRSIRIKSILNRI